MCGRIRFILAIVAVCIGAIGSSTMAGEVFAVGPDVSYYTGFNALNLGVVVKERMSPTYDIDATIRVYWDEGDDRFIAGIATDFAVQWHWNIAGGFNWKVGPLSSVGLCVAGWIDTVFDSYTNRWYEQEQLYYDVCWGIGVQAGVEYDFKAASGIPLILGVNVRPELNILKPKVVDVFSFSVHLNLTYAYK